MTKNKKSNNEPLNCILVKNSFVDTENIEKYPEGVDKKIYRENIVSRQQFYEEKFLEIITDIKQKNVDELEYICTFLKKHKIKKHFTVKYCRCPFSEFWGIEIDGKKFALGVKNYISAESAVLSESALTHMLAGMVGIEERMTYINTKLKKKYGNKYSNTSFKYVNIYAAKANCIIKELEERKTLYNDCPANVYDYKKLLLYLKDYKNISYKEYCAGYTEFIITSEILLKAINEIYSNKKLFEEVGIWDKIKKEYVSDLYDMVYARGKYNSIIEDR